VPGHRWATSNSAVVLVPVFWLVHQVSASGLLLPSYSNFRTPWAYEDMGGVLSKRLSTNWTEGGVADIPRATHNPSVVGSIPTGPAWSKANAVCVRGFRDRNPDTRFDQTVSDSLASRKA
jgi:hypothetical protein